MQGVHRKFSILRGIHLCFRNWLRRYGFTADDALAAVDRRAEGVELFLIAGHNPHGAVLVEVPGLVADLQVTGGEFLQGEGKELFVVGFEMDLTAQLQGPAVLVQEGPVSQAALGVFAPGPRVAEVDI